MAEELDVQVIAKESVPFGHYGRWQKLFLGLDATRAVKITGLDKQGLRKIGNAIQGTFRQARTNEPRIATRVTLNNEGELALYAWIVDKNLEELSQKIAY